MNTKFVSSGYTWCFVLVDFFVSFCYLPTLCNTGYGIWFIVWHASVISYFSHLRNYYSAIRVAAQWYQTHLAGSARILLITNDKENKRKAIEEGISAETGVYNLVAIHVVF